MMNLKEAMDKRLMEKAELRAAEEREKKLRAEAQRVREGVAASLVLGWIERVYGVTLVPGQVVVRESDNNNEPTYEVRIELGDGLYIRATRMFLVSDGRIMPIGSWGGDRPEIGKFMEMWHAVRGELYVEYNDLVDAAIYVLEPVAELTTQELDALFDDGVKDEQRAVHVGLPVA